MSMFLDRATEAHMAWKVKLMTLVNRRMPLDEDISCSDNHCELGRWIYGEGRIFEDNPIYVQLRDKHKQFHDSVGLIVELVRRGKYDDAKDELMNGSFSHLSSAVVAEIVKLKRAALITR